MQLRHHCSHHHCSQWSATCLHSSAHVQRVARHTSSSARILPLQQQQQRQHHLTRSVQQQQYDRPLQSEAAEPTPDAANKRSTDGAAAAALPADAVAAASSGRWQLLSRSELAGGTLEVVGWEGERCLRVWLPPGYSNMDAQRAPYPVVYLNDGQNLFGDCPTLSGTSWNAADTAAQLIVSGKLPPFVIVGIDHAGPLRSLEYTPCTPGSGPGGFRSDAADWPGGGVDAYLDRLRDEVLPWVAANYPVSTDPQDRVFGGSSFGGIAALVAGMRGAEGCGFGALIVESPSLWIGDPEPETFLKEVLAYKGSWPSRLYLGMGGKEYSGTRGGQRAEHDENFPRYLKSLYASLILQGLGPSRVAWAFEPDHAHTESAWAARFAAALQFVGGGWWQRWLQRYQHELFFTIPRRLKAGLSGQLLFINRRNSHTLAGVRGGLKMIVGRNGWEHTQHLPMKFAGEVQRTDLKEPQQLREQVLDGWRAEYRSTQEEQLRHQEQEFQHRMSTERERLAAARAATAASAAAAAAAAAAAGDAGAVVNPAGVGSVAQQEQQLQQWQHHLDDQERQWRARPPLPPAISPQIQSVLYQQPASCSIDEGSSDWLLAELPPLPEDAYEINFVFCDAAGTAYDNNDSNDFWLPVRQPEQLAPHTPGGGGSSSGNVSRPSRSSGTVAAVAATFAGDACGWLSPGRGLEAYAEALDAATAAAARPAEEAVAAAASSCQYFLFSLPPVPVAGATTALYVNKTRLCSGLHEAANLRLKVGFNKWQLLDQLECHPAGANRGGGPDWWRATLHVPVDAMQAHFVFSGDCHGEERWDNNGGIDFQLPLRSALAAAVAASAQASMMAEDAKPAATLQDSNGSSSSSGQQQQQQQQLQPGKPVVVSPLSRAVPAGFALREVESVQSLEHAGGILEILELKKRVDPNSSRKKSSSSKSSGSSSSSSAKEAPGKILASGSIWRSSMSSSSSSSTTSSSNGFGSRRRPNKGSRSSSAIEEDGLTTIDAAAAASSEKAKRQRWWDEKRIRVWLPPGFKAEDAPPGGWPALVMCDGQNMFEDWLSHQGVSWNLGVTAAELISSGAIPPCLCVAIDSAGPYRSYNYLPFPPGTGIGNFRDDAARWPGGGAEEFLGRVQHELLPMLQERYNLAQDPSRLAFGGGSFAGVTALMAAMRLPHVFGGVLVESPSLWTGEGQFLQEIADHSGRLPERLALGCGTREYSATREFERHDVDQMLLNQYHDAAKLLQERGLRGSSRFMFWVDEGAGHHEGAWRWRLNGALRFLAQGWWDS